MARIKGWTKINDVTWKHNISGALVQVVPTKPKGKYGTNWKGETVWDLYVESRNPPKHRRVRVPEIKDYETAYKNAIKWMRTHPNG